MTAGRVGFFERPLAEVFTTDAILYVDAAIPASYPGTGTTWTDLSTYNNNITLVNGPVYNAGNGGYFTFDGTNDYGYGAVQFPNTAEFNTSSTAAAWFRTNVASGKKIVGLENNQLLSANDWDRHIYVGQNGYLYWGRFQTQPPTTVISQFTVTDNVWRYATGVFDDAANLLSLYINGVLQNSTTLTSGQSYSFWTKIGAYKSGWVQMGLDGFFTGDIAHVMMYKRALTLDEIQDNFNATRGRFGV